MADHLTRFLGGTTGQWRVLRTRVVTGAGLAPVVRLAIVDPGNALPVEAADWVLRGVASYERYVTRPERQLLTARQERLGRPHATRAALIPIAKSATWWDLTQDERRAVLETRSGHIRTGARYLPAVARQLYHCRDLGEPFDFLTWFEYAPRDEGAFDELVGLLRDSEEWQFVEREIDMRLERSDG
jgi:hypothetical protein